MPADTVTGPAESEGASPVPGAFSLDYSTSLTPFLQPEDEVEATPETLEPGAPVVMLREGLKRIDWLERSGAKALAASMLVDLRPALEEGVDEWIEWERRLWKNLRARKDWAALELREREILALPESDRAQLPPAFFDELAVNGVDAHLQQRNFSAARGAIRTQLINEDLAPKLRALLRRKIYLSYLWDDNLEDASRAMDRYQIQYFPDDNAWNLLRARVLLQSGQPTRAVSQVASITSNEARLIRLYGRLQDGSLTPNEVIDKAGNLDPAKLKTWQQIERLGIIADAAQRAGVVRIAVGSLEQALSLESDSNHRPIVEPAVEQLLSAYEELAVRVGNGAHLLVGDAEGWLKHADSLFAKSASDARSIYVYIARTTGAPELIAGAWSRFAESLIKDGLQPLVYKLFGDGKPLGGFDAFEPAFAMKLSEQAMKSGNMKRAAALSAHLVSPPEGLSWLDWNLRQARLQVYAGNAEVSVEILNQLFDAVTKISSEEIDRILQVVFDLQTLGRHGESISLLERLIGYSTDRSQQRELLFWLGESLEGSGNNERAALFFLRSATFGNAADLWTQTARYRAAGALEKAGHINDARVLYRNLLAVTRDPKRREQLTRKLQDLWLLETRENLSS